MKSTPLNLFLFARLFVPALSAQTPRINRGGIVNGASPSNTATVYGAAGAGVFKSTNGGATWMPTGWN